MDIQRHLVFAGLIRLGVILYGEWHDRNVHVKFTDVDYRVFTDAAMYVVNGSSPFLRHTYRYTPFLAFLLVPNCLFNAFGKVLFSVFDLITAYAIFKMARSFKMLSASLWLYNPMCILICTRGNAECIMTTLTVVFLHCLMTQRYNLAAVLYGFSVHFKIYPVIYALTVYFHMSKKPILANMIPNKQILLFGFVAFMAFSVPSALSYALYSEKYLFEALLYHLNRKDIRHNFSPYFYFLYLTDLTETNNLKGLLVFVPQLFLVMIFSIKFHNKHDLAFNFFCSTFVFVMFNKVCTSQYFLWFLCYIPLIVSRFDMSIKKAVYMGGVWLGSQALWLSMAYLLEFRGVNTFFYVWLCGMCFFCINLWILNELVKTYTCSKKKKG